MRLLSPYALFLLPLVAVLLMLARRRIPRPRRAVANLYLWRQTQPPDPARLAIARLRTHRLLALQIAFMLAVIAALARPAVTWTSRRAAFVFDVSASMGARDGSATRLELAKRNARAVLGTLPWPARVRLFSAGATTVDLGEFGANDAALARAIDGLQPTAASSSLVDAVRRAGTSAAGVPVYVFSDTDDPNPAGSDPVRWQRVGSAADNIAITALSARRLPARPADGQVLVEVHNFGSQARDVPLDILQDDAIVARDVLRVDRRSVRTIVADVAHLGGIVTARLNVDDALGVDNRRFAVAPPIDRLRVLHVPRGSFFLEKALVANPALEVDRERKVGVRYDVVVCEACTDVPGDDAGVLMVHPVARASGASEPLTLGLAGHPVARALDVVGVFAVTASGPSAPSDGEVVLRAGGRPALVVYEHDGRRVVDLNVDLTKSALSLTTAFPVLMANAVEWIAAQGENASAIAAGEPLQWRRRHPAALDRAGVIGPNGQQLPFQAAGRSVTVTATDAAGVYGLRSASGEDRFVVNPATETESDLGRGAAQANQRAEAAVEGASPDLRDSASRVLLAIALCLLLVEWRYWSGQERGRAALSCRAAVAALLGLAALGLRLPMGREPATVIFALDRSASVPGSGQAAALARVNGMTATMGAADRAGVVAFGEEAATERPPATRFRLSGIASRISPSGTNIEAALGLARAALPPGGTRRIVLVSDGRETIGLAAREAALAAADAVRIDVVPVDQDLVQKPLVINAVTAPSDVRIAEPFLVSVDVTGAPGARGRVTVSTDGEAPVARDVAIAADGTASVIFTDERRRAGVYTYRAAAAVRREGDADFDTEAVGGTMVSVSGAPNVLHIGPAGGPVAGLLAQSGFRVREVAALATASAELAAYDAVVLDNVPPGGLPPASWRALAAYVEEAGGGLLVLGGRQSLDAAGDPDSPLSKLLPIDLRPRSGRRGPAVGLVVVFDKSGSMADVVDGVAKIEVARQAVKRVLDVVPSTDSVGVVAFDAAPVVVSPLAASRDNRALAARLGDIRPGGPTAIAPAMTVALDWLRGARVARRHVLLVSDGRTAPADAERLRALSRQGGFELSIIAIGADADRPYLGEIAGATGGRAYFPDDIRQLPMLAAREAARAAGGGVVEEPFSLRAAVHPISAGLDRASMPALGGYVVAALKSGAESILLSHLDDPVLAAWRFGLGRVAVYTADLRSPWSQSLRGWSGFGPLWLQSMRWLSRRASDRSLQVSIIDGPGGTRLVVEAAGPSGDFANLLNMRATLRAPNGSEQALPMRATAPGRYEAGIETPESGPYLVAISALGADGASDLRALRGFYRSADRERRASGADLAALARLAEATGGRVLGPADNPFTESRPYAFSDVWRELAGGALLLFLVEIALRRGVAFPRLSRRAPGAATTSKAAA